MAEIPHYYIVRDNLSENNKKLFDEFDMFIKRMAILKSFILNNTHISILVIINIG